MFNKKDMMWFANLNCKELKEELKKRGVKGYYKMKKEQLQETLLNLLEQEREEVVVEEVEEKVENEEIRDEEVRNDEDYKKSDFVKKMEYYREKFKRDAEERERKKEEESKYQRMWSEAHHGKEYSYTDDLLEKLFKGKLVIPVEGQEDKVNRMLKDLAKIYHPDKPTGDSQMMIFVNEIKNEFRKAN